MAQRRKEPVLSLPVAAGTVVTGGLLDFGVSVVCLAAAAGLITLGKLGEAGMFQACCIGCFLGGVIGGAYTALNCRSRMLLVALGAAAVGTVLWMLVGTLFYGGITLGSAGAFLAVSLIGGGVAGMVSAGLGKK